MSAAQVIADAWRIGVERFEVRPADITTPRPRLLLAFLAALMGKHPGLEDVDGFDLSDIMKGGAEEEAEREERTCRTWMTLHPLIPPYTPLYPLTVSCAVMYAPSRPEQERTFRMWMTSLGLDLQIGNLVSNCRTRLPMHLLHHHTPPYTPIHLLHPHTPPTAPYTRWHRLASAHSR